MAAIANRYDFSFSRESFVEKYFVPVVCDKSLRKKSESLIKANLLILGLHHRFRVCLLEFYPLDPERWFVRINRKQDKTIKRIPITKQAMFNLVKELLNNQWILIDVGYYVEDLKDENIEMMLENEEYHEALRCIEENIDVYANVRAFYLTKRFRDNELIIDIVYNALVIRDYPSFINDKEYMDLIIAINNVFRS